MRRVSRIHRIHILRSVVGTPAVRAPMPFVLASRGVVHNDALVDVTIRDEDLVGLRVDVEVCGPAEVSGIVAPLVDARLTDGEHVLAVLGELHHVHAVARAHPHEAVVVDVDAVLLVEPRIPVAGPAPGSQHLALCVQLQYRRSGNAAISDGRLDGCANFLWREAGWHVDHPQVVLVVHEQSTNVPENPVVRQRRRPRGIDFVDRQPLGRWRPRVGLGVRPLRASHSGHEQRGHESCECARTLHDRDYRSSRPPQPGHNDDHVREDMLN